MRYIVFDLEATCWRQHDRSDNETIEIGAVRCDDAGAVVDEFCQFVRPLRHPRLSDFCRQLTSIRQADVDAAPLFHEAIERFKAWIGVGAHPYLLCSWGYYDRRQLEADCALHHLDSAWVARHISLKHQHAELAGLRRALGMARALEHEGLPLEGTHHRGIDDARNIAKVFGRYLGRWRSPTQ